MNRRLPMDENGSIPLDDLIYDRAIREALAGVAKDACERRRECPLCSETLEDDGLCSVGCLDTGDAVGPRLRVLKGTRATACLGPAGRIAIAGARR